MAVGIEGKSACDCGDENRLVERMLFVKPTRTNHIPCSGHELGTHIAVAGQHAKGMLRVRTHSWRVINVAGRN